MNKKKITCYILFSLSFFLTSFLTSCPEENPVASGNEINFDYEVNFSLSPTSTISNNIYTYSPTGTHTLTVIKTNFISKEFSNNYFSFSANPANVLEVISVATNALEFRLTNMEPGLVTITATATNVATNNSAGTTNGVFTYRINLKKANYPEFLISYAEKTNTNEIGLTSTFKVKDDNRSKYGPSTGSARIVSGNATASMATNDDVEVSATSVGISLIEVVWVNPNYVNYTNELTFVSIANKPYLYGVTQLKDQTSVVYNPSCSQTNFNNSYDGSGLKITEVSYHWIELFNTNQAGGNTVCLNNYKLRSSTKNETPLGFSKYTLPNIAIPPQSYFIIRFYGNAQNNSSSMIIRTDLGMYSKNNYRVGLFELLKTNTTTMQEETIDFVRLCTDGLGNTPGSPTTGAFSSCLSFPSSQYLYGSFSLNGSLADNDNATDWTYRNIVTFGGKNDVTVVTDTDRDGIPDANEQPGATFAGMPVYDWGARSGRRDIFVHMAYMDGEDYMDKNVLTKIGLTPFKESFEHIRRVFSSNGYSIHFDLGTRYSATMDPLHFNLSSQTHEVPYSEYVDISENAVSSAATPDAASIILYKNRYMPVNRFGIFHFSLIANAYSYTGIKVSAGGVAELPGNDFLVFTGGYLAQNDSDITKHNRLATIIMHELGHNLNLGHGGHDHENYKPNYFSIMNYGYAYSGVPSTNDPSRENFLNRYLNWSGRKTNNTIYLKNTFRTNTFNMNFSYGVMPNLNEESLSEVIPLGAGIGNVDWDMNGVITTNINLDINHNPSSPNSNNGKTVLKDYADWDNLQLPFDQILPHIGGGYGNLQTTDSIDDHHHDEDSASTGEPPHGSALVSEEGKSPYIVDKFPEWSDIGQ